MTEAAAVESTNENTAEAPQPIVKVGGDDVATFDELERLHDRSMTNDRPIDEGIVEENRADPLPDAKKAPEEAAEVKAEEAEEPPQAEEVKSGKEKEKPKEPEEEEELEQAAKADKVDAAAEKVKLYKVKNGDSEVDLRADTAIDVTVAGKKESVPLQDLMNNYSGKTDWTRKYTELDTERKSFQQDRSVVQGTIDQFYKLAVTNNDPKSAVDYLGEVTGQDMKTFWQKFNAQLEPMIKKRMEMSEEERLLADKEEEIQLLKRREQREQASRKQSDEAKQIEERIAKVQNEHGLELSEFERLYTELKELGEVPLEDITPEDVGQYHQELTALQGIEEMLSDVNPDLKGNDLEGAVDELRDVMVKHDDLEISDLRDIAIEVYGSKASKNIARKLEKSKPVNTASIQKTQETDWNPVSWEEV